MSKLKTTLITTTILAAGVAAGYGGSRIDLRSQNNNNIALRADDGSIYVINQVAPTMLPVHRIIPGAEIAAEMKVSGYVAPVKAAWFNTYLSDGTIVESYTPREVAAFDPKSAAEIEKKIGKPFQYGNLEADKKIAGSVSADRLIPVEEIMKGPDSDYVTAVAQDGDSYIIYRTSPFYSAAFVRFYPNEKGIEKIIAEKGPGLNAATYMTSSYGAWNEMTTAELRALPQSTSEQLQAQLKAKNPGTYAGLAAHFASAPAVVTQQIPSKAELTALSDKAYQRDGTQSIVLGGGVGAIVGVAVAGVLATLTSEMIARRRQR